MKWVALLAAVALVGCHAYPRYAQSFELTRPIDGIVVSAQDAGGGFWEVTATNNLQEPVMLLWDESAYVATDGTSKRIIRGTTKRIHTDRDQPPHPIPPGATLQETCAHQDFVYYITNSPDTYVSCLRPVDPNGTGRLHLVFKVANEKRVCEIAVMFERDRTPQPDTDITHDGDWP